MLVQTVLSPVLFSTQEAHGHQRHKLVAYDEAHGHPLHESTVRGGADDHSLRKLVSERCDFFLIQFYDERMNLNWYLVLIEPTFFFFTNSRSQFESNCLSHNCPVRG